MAAAPAPFWSSLAPNDQFQNDQLHDVLISDPKFAVHGEIMMLVLVLLFATLFILLLLFPYTKKCPPSWWSQS
ncbi:unnamed protein product [Prunus armeniaca]|uniref:Uncharacterized protein n=2 Tax=Prunus armeniaca TaxID=36596 RepID=A0A6J5XNM2_PRUAR|nr:hypothetical protein GBA52_019092 [Prunus armeniaca]CAB4315249.1 unnamed protein product [Prunus armeniaca]